MDIIEILSSNNIKKAKENILKADKIITMSLTKSKEDKYENAYNLYIEAGNIYKFEGKIAQALIAYSKGLECCEKMKQLNGLLKSVAMENATTTAVEIARLSKQINDPNVIRYYKTALDMLYGSSNINLIGKLWCEYAKIYRNQAMIINEESNNENYNIAIEAYKKAIKCYISSGYYYTTSMKPLNECINLMIITNKYKNIIQEFDAIISNDYSGPALYWLLRGAFINTMFCSMICENFTITKNRIQEYLNYVGNNSISQKDANFLMQIMNAIESNDKNMFDEIISTYNTSNHLNTYTIKLLVNLKTKYFDNILNDNDKKKMYKEIL
jgi:tetratricopeptide (TPR) repeat protein